MARQRKPAPTFQVVFEGTNVSPERIPLRSLTDSLSAVQRIISGSEFDEEEAAPEDDAVSLLDVQRGSAKFQCVARRPKVALENIRTTGRILERPEAGFTEAQEYVLSPIRDLSRIARQLECRISIRLPGRDADVLALIDRASYERVAETAIVRGQTSVEGQVVRVGGATENRCALRVPGRQRLLYCLVETREISRELGQRLYDVVATEGTAEWVLPSWRLFSYRVAGLMPRPTGGLLDGLRELYRAGGSEWDRIKDPERFLKELRE